jgi:hypothetical protein
LSAVEGGHLLVELRRDALLVSEWRDGYSKGGENSPPN